MKWGHFRWDRSRKISEQTQSPKTVEEQLRCSQCGPKASHLLRVIRCRNTPYLILKPTCILFLVSFDLFILLLIYSLSTSSRFKWSQNWQLCRILACAFILPSASTLYTPGAFGSTAARSLAWPATHAAASAPSSSAPLCSPNNARALLIPLAPRHLELEHRRKRIR